MRLIGTILLMLGLFIGQAQEHSVARQWNEVLLEAIRNDLARPTVHARNLFHISAAMYDAWAVYDEVAVPYFLGRANRGFVIPFDGIEMPDDIQAARDEAISYAAYRLLKHRFSLSPGYQLVTREIIDSKFAELGYDYDVLSTDYSTGSPAALGNYLAEKIIEFGFQDGSNEQNNYANRFYEPTNPAFYPLESGDPTIVDPNRWQPLAFEVFIDQSGNEVGGGQPPFLSPEWGSVTPFSLSYKDLTIHERDGNEYWVYHDPGPPPFLDPETGMGDSEYYKWGFELVSVWSSHLDPSDGVMWDISPASQGNITDYPTSFTDYDTFYDLEDGGDPAHGYEVNPATGLPYEPQLVPRGDYARVLAEFWADGPDSETPPGHWFTILNWVNDHPELEKKFMGEGEEIDDLEWDVKSYFILGGAMHDVAVAVWGAKGYYDYIRPVCAIRYLVQQGQSSDPSKPSYHPAGVRLIPDFVELVEEGDPLAGSNGENIGKIKLKAWKGHKYILNPLFDNAGVDWILGEDWIAYQRPSFVTPPFAGYMSGHSTFSRAAAEALTLLTGDEYFPGGMSTFPAPAYDFLVFEAGPSTDLVLQWAKYRDASDQCSLSRIWGGIHPPADDIPGRLIGMEMGVDAFHYAENFFNGEVLGLEKKPLVETMTVYPNPFVEESLKVRFNTRMKGVTVELISLTGQVIRDWAFSEVNSETISLEIGDIQSGYYLIKVSGNKGIFTERLIVN